LLAEAVVGHTAAFGENTTTAAFAVERTLAIVDALRLAVRWSARAESLRFADTQVGTSDHGAFTRGPPDQHDHERQHDRRGVAMKGVCDA